MVIQEIREIETKRETKRVAGMQEGGGGEEGGGEERERV